MSDIQPGDSFPLGATVQPGGVNFSVFSKGARRAELLLFDRPEDDEPSRVIKLRRRHHRTFHYWHVFVPGVNAGQVYGWRLDGAMDPEAGHRFDARRLLLDPYARAIVNTANFERFDAMRDHEGYATDLKGLVVDATDYDWEGDRPLERPFARTVIYEMHVGGFTKHPNSGVEPDRKGTFRGLIDKIPYLQSLGITAVELLPVFQFDVQDAPGDLPNYWGYSPISFFAPHAPYASADGLDAVNEFRDMVKALHRAGIEVILDVVYNHTAEGDERGPTYSFRGLDNATYYMLDDDGEYLNFSGCGNTLNANVSVVRRLILDSLRYWVREMHVDGFRFDLASILTRDESGEPMLNPPLLWDIETDPVLAGTKLIAEAWDAAGLYQVGDFFGHHWKEWNGRFRDDVRAFLRGDDGALRRAAPRILASPDLYEHRGGAPDRSVNFVTSHDGFTLNDLVSYERKHNEANQEGNRDGDDHNVSWNFGVEGPTDDPEIEALRERQIRNFMTILMVSLGVPMITMGDEVRRTQQGNNNAYCQDNETSWFDWERVEEHADLRRFVTGLIRLRLSLLMHQDQRGRTLTDLLESADVLRWHGVRLGQPDWSDHSRSIAIEVRGPSGIFFLILNAFSDTLEFELPSPGSRSGWRRLVDTSLPSPKDILAWEDAPVIDGRSYIANRHSVVVLSALITKLPDTDSPKTDSLKPDSLRNEATDESE